MSWGNRSKHHFDLMTEAPSHYRPPSQANTQRRTKQRMKKKQTMETVESLQKSLEKLRNRGKKQRRKEKQKTKRLLEKHAELEERLAQMNENVDNIPLYRYANALKQQDADLIIPSYVLRLQSQVCRATHIETMADNSQEMEAMELENMLALMQRQARIEKGIGSNIERELRNQLELLTNDVAAMQDSYDSILCRQNMLLGRLERGAVRQGRLSVVSEIKIIDRYREGKESNNKGDLRSIILAAREGIDNKFDDDDEVSLSPEDLQNHSSLTSSGGDSLQHQQQDSKEASNFDGENEEALLPLDERETLGEIGNMSTPSRLEYLFGMFNMSSSNRSQTFDFDYTENEKPTTFHGVSSSRSRSPSSSSSDWLTRVKEQAFIKRRSIIGRVA